MNPPLGNAKELSNAKQQAMQNKGATQQQSKQKAKRSKESQQSP